MCLLDIANRRHTIIPPAPLTLDQRLEWSFRFVSGPLVKGTANNWHIFIDFIYSTTM